MEIGNGMNHLTFRLKSGRFFKEEIESRTSNIQAGVLLSIVGALENVNLRMAGAVCNQEDVKSFDGPFEIVSGTGTISKDGCHIHLAVSDKNGRVIGGHLKNGCKVGVTAEVVVGIFEDVVYERVLDENTGFKELCHKMNMLKPGIYKHYKGNEYLLIGKARHSETLEDLVVYKALYGDGEIWVRPFEMFIGQVEVCGKTVPRFVWIRD